MLAKLRLPFHATVALTSSLSGWIAAFYGALYIFAAGDFAATGTLWLFGWPFALLLTTATAAHVLVAGGGEALGLPSSVPWVRVLNRVVHTEGGGKQARDDLATALVHLPWAPVAHTLWSSSFSLAVVAGMVALEWAVSGSTRNVLAILTGGAIAILLYAAATLSVCELMISKPCQRLRLAGAVSGLDPYTGTTIPTWARVLVFAAPTVLALVVAVRLQATPGLPLAWLLQAALLVVSGGICGALAWLQALAIRTGATDLGVAATRLARGETAYLVSGSVDRHLVDMARAFNAAAGEINRSQQVSAARYEALFEGAGDAIVLYDEESGRVLEANRRAQELTIRGEETLRRTRFTELFESGPYAVRGAGLEPGATHWPTTTLLRADGSRCPVDVALSTVQLRDRTVIQAILHDVSHRERIERELRRALARLEGHYQLAVTLGGSVEQVADHVTTALAQLIETPIVGVERLEGDDLVVLAMSTHGAVTHGLRMPLAGTPCEQVRRERRACIYTDAVARFPTDGFLVDHGLQTYVGLPISGRRGEVEGVLFVLDTRVRTLREEDMRLLSTYAERLARAFDEEEYARERETLVRQLSAQNAELNAAKERLTAADRLKSEFMGMMSHELRTPINIFIGYTELLLDASRAAPAAAGDGDVLERMLDAARTLASLVEDTLSVLRLETAGMAMNLEPVSIAALFGELRGAARFSSAPADVREQWEVADDLPPVVSDRLKLRQILTNLVGNARKFTQAGTITVRAASGEHDAVVLSVSDTGCGIAGTDLPHIFELYRQAGGGGPHNGCGIGLFIVRRYCELLGGRVEVASELGRGTRFTVTLPRLAAATAAVAPDRSAA